MAMASFAGDRDSATALQRLPLVTLYLTERCNSRCASCDWWQSGRKDLGLADVARMLPALERLGTREVLVSGGEPLLNPEWHEIARLLRDRGLRLWLLTAGLALAKHAAKVAALFDVVTVSLDGASTGTYRAIRGVDAFDAVCSGIRAVARTGVPVGVRVTVHRANYRELPALVTLARELGAGQISFLAADLANPHAFGARHGDLSGLALDVDDLAQFEPVLDALEDARGAPGHDDGFIAESPRKLRRILDYYRALHGLGEFPPVRCNAPEFSAVVAADGRVDPCFFIRGPAREPGVPLDAAVNAEPLTRLRADVRARRRPECRSCVCSLWREPDAATGAPAAAFLPF